MINNLKLGIRVMKYGHSAKLSFVAGIAFMVFGLVLSILSIMGGVSFPGGYFIMMSVLLLMQLVATVSAANLVQASPAKKKLQTSVPAIFSVVLMTAGYLVNLVTTGVAGLLSPKDGNVVEAACNQLICTAIIMGIVMLYVGVCYKKFVAATIMFFIGFFIMYRPMFEGRVFWKCMPFSNPAGNFALAGLAGLGIIFVCGLLQYLLSLALYRQPISKMALGANLRRQL